MKIVENHFAFFELAVIKPIILSADSDSALFKLVNPKFLIRWNKTLEASDAGIEITAVNNVNLHLISYSISIFENKQQFFWKSAVNRLKMIQRVILVTRVRLTAIWYIFCYVLIFNLWFWWSVLFSKKRTWPILIIAFVPRTDRDLVWLPNRRPHNCQLLLNFSFLDWWYWKDFSVRFPPFLSIDYLLEIVL